MKAHLACMEAEERGRCDGSGCWGPGIRGQGSSMPRERVSSGCRDLAAEQEAQQLDAKSNSLMRLQVADVEAEGGEAGEATGAEAGGAGGGAGAGRVAGSPRPRQSWMLSWMATS